MSRTSSSLHIRKSSSAARTLRKTFRWTLNIGYIIGTWRSSAYYSAYSSRHKQSTGTRLVM